MSDDTVTKPRPYYSENQRRYLATLFGDTALDTLDAAGRALHELQKNPPGTTQGCQTHRCHMRRIKVAEPNGGMFWLYINYATGSTAMQEPPCVCESRKHGWGTLGTGRGSW